MALQKPDQSVTIFSRHLHDGISLVLRFASVPEDRFKQRTGSAVMQEISVARDLFGQSDPPQRGRPPFGTGRAGLGAVVGKPWSHIVQQHVSVRPNQLEALFGPIFQPVCYEGRLMAGRTARGVKDLFAVQNVRVINIAPCRYPEVAAVECHKVKPFGIDFEASVIAVAMRCIATV